MLSSRPAYRLWPSWTHPAPMATQRAVQARQMRTGVVLPRVLSSKTRQLPLLGRRLHPLHGLLPTRPLSEFMAHICRPCSELTRRSMLERLSSTTASLLPLTTMHSRRARADEQASQRSSRRQPSDRLLAFVGSLTELCQAQRLH